MIDESLVMEFPENDTSLISNESRKTVDFSRFYGEDIDI